jgi:hypothetical protein
MKKQEKNSRGMLKEKLPIELICKITGMTENEIKKLNK